MQQKQDRITSAPLAPPTLVNTGVTFQKMLSRLEGQRLIALDTESNSLYRYYPKVCLIQLTAFADPNDQNPNKIVDYLLDPLALKDLQPLGTLLKDPTVEVIMHAADNDILILQRDFDFQFHTIFDTQLAARVLGWQRIGLGAILQHFFGVTSDKRMQRTDWGRRPLTAQQIKYAQMDTHYLPALRAKMVQELKAADRWEEAQEAFSMLQLIDYNDREPSSRSFWQMRQLRDVPQDAYGVLEALWQWREAEAQKRDRPPFKIATDQALIALAIEQPNDLNTLSAIRGLGQQQIHQQGRSILQSIAEGRKRPIPEPPVNERQEAPEKSVQNRYDTLRQWRTQVAEERGVAPEIVFSNHILMALAQRMPTSEVEMTEIPEIGPWKARTYGQELLAILHET